MIFACCHPSLHIEDQIALTLKAISGFSVSEIARAFMTGEEAIKKRLYRAKEYIRNNQINLDIPSGQQLHDRLETVYTILYLLFNEGYNATHSEEIIRKDLCAEAMRLCLMLSKNSLGKQPTTFALLSLMCFQASRFESRIDDQNSIVLLEFQDRKKWDKNLIILGYSYLNQSSEGTKISIYHLEAAIAAEHCRVDHFLQTDWRKMLMLYDLLLEQKRTPIVLLNRAIIYAQIDGPAKGIKDVLMIPDIEKLLEKQYIYSAVLGDLYLKAGIIIPGRNYLQKAWCLTKSNAEKNLIMKKIRSIETL
jgi:RNA polymerase sigma-70 factor (ECF subfamily)